MTLESIPRGTTVTITIRGNRPPLISPAAPSGCACDSQPGLRCLRDSCAIFNGIFRRGNVSRHGQKPGDPMQELISKQVLMEAPLHPALCRQNLRHQVRRPRHGRRAPQGKLRPRRDPAQIAGINTSSSTRRPADQRHAQTLRIVSSSCAHAGHRCRYHELWRWFGARSTRRCRYLNQHAAARRPSGKTAPFVARNCSRSAPGGGSVEQVDIASSATCAGQHRSVAHAQGRRYCRWSPVGGPRASATTSTPTCGRTGGCGAYSES